MAHPRQSSVAVIANALRSKKLMTFPVCDHPISIDETEKYRQLLDKVRTRMQTRTGYQRLAGLICFFAMYSMAILLQQRVEDSFSIESSFIMTNIIGALPTNGQGGVFNAGGPGGVGMLTDSTEFLQWMSQTIVPALFQDAVCGDGKCDADEQAAVGRFGCAKDCGRAPNADKIVIEIMVDESSGEQKNSRAFLIYFDLCSSVYQDFLFQKPISPSNISIKIEVLRWDKLELRLYQTNSLVPVMNKDQIQIGLTPLARTIPERNSKADYDYGDPFEILAVAAMEVDLLRAACWSSDYNPICAAESNGVGFEPISWGLYLLNSYGLFGYALASHISSKTGKLGFEFILDSPNNVLLPCTVFPEMPYSWPSMFVDTFPSMLIAVQDAAVLCDSTRTRRLVAEPAQYFGGLESGAGRGLGWKTLKASKKSQLPLAGRFSIPPKDGLPAPWAGGLNATKPHPSTISGARSHSNGPRRNAGGRSSPGSVDLMQPSLADVGLDAGGTLYCQGDADICYFADAPDVILSMNWSAPSPDPALTAAYRYPGPLYAVIDVVESQSYVDLRFSVDGTEVDCAAPLQAGPRYCTFVHESEQAVQVARHVTYGGRERIVLYAVSDSATWTAGWADSTTPSPVPNTSSLLSCSNLQLQLCSNGSAGNLTSINVTDALAQIVDDRFAPVQSYLGPLQPGPIVKMSIVLVQSLDSSALLGLRQRLCAAVWNTSDPAHADRCEWQLWAELSSDAHGEIWDDDQRKWMPTSVGFGDGEVDASYWTVTVTALLDSNGNASRAKFEINKEVNSASFISTFHVAKVANITVSGDSGTRTGNKQYFAHVIAPFPPVKRASDSKLGCVSHYECQDGYFCSVYGYHAFAFPSQASCDRCETCLDSDMHPVDGFCPEDRCGPRVGTFPKCWDAEKLLSNLKCPSSLKLNLSLIPDFDTSVNPKTTLGDMQPPTLRARYLTPFNRLVGGVIIRQKRLQSPEGVTNGSFAVCSIKNDSIGRYCSTADPSRGLLCRGNTQDTAFFGMDPVFTTASRLYDGKQNPFNFYNSSEFAVLSTLSPFGFFPHSYDHLSGSSKNITLVSEEANNFLVFLDERISSVHAQDIITYLNDGGYIDEQTQEITVEFNTLNAGSSIFCKIFITFTWQIGGGIKWDYRVSSVPIYTDSSGRSMILEYLCMALLGLNVLAELSDVFKNIRKFTVLEYLTSPANWLDWAHFSLMTVGWVLWYIIVWRSSMFTMQPKFDILASTVDQTPARFLLTNAHEEKEFLLFSQSIASLEQSIRFYTNIVGLCVIVFVLRLLKGLDFQPRMALVTRTISGVTIDLLHFLVLFSIIFLGFTLAGYILFGHQNEAFSSFSNSAQFLVLMLLAFDPNIWIQMEHAAPSFFMFAVFIWAWIFMASFILLNIFLAILIEGYTKVKEGMADSKGLLEELQIVLSHEIRRLLQFIWRGPPTFLSDDRLAKELAALIKNAPTSMNQAMSDYASVALCNYMEVRLAAGGRMDTEEVHAMLKRLPFSLEQDGTSDVSGRLNEALMDFMKRYGKIMGEIFHDSAEKSVHTVVSSSGDVTVIGEVQSPQVVVSLRLERARGVGRMDFGKGADLFCVAFIIDSRALHGYRGNLHGNRLFQTKVMRGKTEDDWTWNEAFVWTLSLAKCTDEVRVIVLLYDKDQFTKDDIVGCLEVGLGRINKEGPISGWEPLVSPIVRTFGGRLWQRLTGPPPQPELRLTASAQLCGVDTLQDTDTGLPVEMQDRLASSKLGAADSLISSGCPAEPIGLCTEETGRFGLYSALVFDNTLLPMPRRAQQSTLSSSPQQLPKEVLPHAPLLSPRLQLALSSSYLDTSAAAQSLTETLAPVSGPETGSC